MRDETRRRLEGLNDENEGHRLTMDLLRPRFDALRTRHEDGTAPRAVSSFNLFQTPEPLAARLVELANIQPGQSVLEPSAGLGRLVKEVARFHPGIVVACESSQDLTAELYRAFDFLHIVQRDFLADETTAAILDRLEQPLEGSLEEEMDGPELFDQIVMNPPFKMRADIKHILRAMEFLKAGGTLTGLCLDGHKREETLRPYCHHWEKVPAGAFKSEGTNVPTILFQMTI